MQAYGIKQQQYSRSQVLCNPCTAMPVLIWISTLTARGLTLDVRI